MRDNPLLLSFAGLSIACELVVLFSLLKLWSAGELPKSSATYYGLNIWLLVILLLSHCIDIVFTPFLMTVSLTEDSFVCSLHGVCYIYSTLWFYSISMFVAVETFVYANSHNVLHSQSFYKVYFFHTRFRVYVILSFFASSAEMIFMSKTVGFGRNILACTFRGTYGPNTAVSLSNVWKFHAYPAVTFSICVVSIFCTVIVLRARGNMKNSDTLKIASRMSLLPLLGFFPWVTVILAKYNLVILPVREIAALRGTCISLFIFVMNDHVRKYVMQKICQCYARKRHNAGDLEEDRDIRYVELD